MLHIISLLLFCVNDFSNRFKIKLVFYNCHTAKKTNNNFFRFTCDNKNALLQVEAKIN